MPKLFVKRLFLHEFIINFQKIIFFCLVFTVFWGVLEGAPRTQAIFKSPELFGLTMEYLGWKRFLGILSKFQEKNMPKNLMDLHNTSQGDR